MAQVGADNLGESVRNHMRRDYVSLRATQTINEALESLRSIQLPERIIYFYVVDADERLLGVVPTRRLLMSPPQRPIADIMVVPVISIPDSMTVLDACEFFVMHRLLAFPVVDPDNRLIGVMDAGQFADEMFNVTERQSDQDVFQLIGIHVAQSRARSPWSGFKDRFPWLLCNITGGILCAAIASLYEPFLNSVIVLALFIPVVLALSESVSVQSMSITLQAMREGRADWRLIRRSLRSEALTSCLLGGASGTVVALVALVWKRQPAVALAIGASIWLAIVTSCLLGVVLPTMVRALRGDPRIAAGPVVLATADVATLLFYFNLAGVMLRHHAG